MFEISKEQNIKNFKKYDNIYVKEIYRNIKISNVNLFFKEKFPEIFKELDHEENSNVTKIVDDLEHSLGITLKEKHKVDNPETMILSNKKKDKLDLISDGLIRTLALVSNTYLVFSKDKKRLHLFGTRNSVSNQESILTHVYLIFSTDEKEFEDIIFPNIFKEYASFNEIYHDRFFNVFRIKAKYLSKSLRATYGSKKIKVYSSLKNKKELFTSKFEVVFNEDLIKSNAKKG